LAVPDELEMNLPVRFWNLRLSVEVERLRIKVKGQGF